ncbi:ORF6N domain-containing protein, partial [Mesorhizobium sp. Root552]|uniref:ORF6N domain-containing protein n=1 Tax=Mesorhizobium sp. Root552 TaxID=1736555 RepID=UPI001AEBB53B
MIHLLDRNLPSISIGGIDIQKITYRDEPVVTFAIVDEVHQRSSGTAGRNFRENKTRFVEGEDFVEIG